MYRYDNRVVITLDAGGTNLVFGAMQANKFIVEPITKPSNADNLDKCLATMVEGFQAVIDQLEEKPVAISFAFPGPADYPNGIIGGYLPNFPSFREGVALGPFLEYKFGIPVFINNDGDLFAYGEALGGALPEVNAKLEALGCPKRYKNLVGYTFGTGLGVGIVVNNQLNRGDNSCVETFCLKHKKMPDIIVEDGAAIRAVKRVYGELTGNPNHGLEPKELCDIADGKREGDAEAARKAFAEMGEIARDNGWYLSFSGTVSYKGNDGIRESARLVGLDHIMVETDAPYLTPMPYRGRTNAPYMIPYTLTALADVFDLPVAEVARATRRTTRTVYGV